MPSLSGNNNVKITVTTEADTKGIKQTEESLTRLSDEAETKVSALSTHTAAVAGAVAGAVQSLATNAISALANTVSDAVRRVDTLNNSSKVFANLGFQASDVNVAMSDLKESILGLPTALDQGVQGLESLALQNGNIRDAQKEFTAMNDAVLASGHSTAALENAIQQVTQLDMSGPLDAQTWNSLKQSGLEPALKAMANMATNGDMGELKTQFGNGTLVVSDFMKMLRTLDTQGTGSMASFSKQAHDMTSGIGTGFANMKTAITRGLADIIQAIGAKNISDLISNFGAMGEKALKAVADGFKKADDAVKTLFGPSLKALWDTITTKLMPALEKWKPQIEEIAKAIGVTLYAAAWLVINTLNVFLKSFAWVIDAIKNGNPFIIVLTGAFIGLAAAMAFNRVFDAINIGFTMMRLVTIPSMIASIGAMQAVILAPLVMPAIAVGAAIAALALVENAANRARAAVQGAQDAATAATSSNAAVIKQLNDLIKNGTPEQKTRAKAAMAGLAARGSFASGGFTGSGAADEIAGIVHKGEYVVPKNQVDQSTGKPKSIGNTQVTTNFYGNIHLGDSSAVQSFFAKLDQDTILAGRGMTPNRGTM